jgi:hypothetical protein
VYTYPDPPAAPVLEEGGTAVVVVIVELPLVIVAEVIEEVPEGGEAVTLPAGLPAVELGLRELIQESSPAPTVMRFEEPPVPLPRSSPASNSSTVPARTLHRQSNSVAPWAASSRKVVPPGITP